MESNSILVQWLGTYLVHSTVLALLALASPSIKALRTAHVQDALLKLALLTGIFSASLQVFTPYGSPLDLRASSTTMGSSQSSANPATAPPNMMTESTHGERSPTETNAAPAKPGFPIGADQAAPASEFNPVLLLWSLGILFLGGRIAHSLISLRRLLKHRQPVPAGPLYQEFRDLCVTAGLKRASLSFSANLSNPVALIGREVCVPESSLTDLQARSRKAILAHEIGHLTRHDPQWQWVFRSVEVLLFVQPLNFLLTRRLSRLSELLSDGWAVQSGSAPRDLAECLLAFARQQTQLMPTVACPMVGSRPTLSNRIQSLLENRAMTTRNTSRTLPLLAPAILVGTLLLPGMTNGMDWFKSNSRGATVEVNGRGNTTRINSMYRDDGIHLDVSAKGQFSFDNEESDLLSINDGGWFEISYEVAGDRHHFEFEGKDGMVVRSYSLNGEQQTFDQKARAVLAEALPIMFRVTGIDAEARVARLLGNGGTKTVIEEIEKIDSDLVMRIYVSSLAQQTNLNDNEVVRLLELMEDQLSSDLEHRLALSSLIESQDLSKSNWQTLINSSEQISSDLEQRLTLSLAATRMPDDRDLLAAYVQASNEISSDLEHRLALTALESYQGFDDETLSLLLRATANISSDLEQRLTLARFAEQSASSPAVVDYIDASREISSDLEARLALSSLLKAGPDADSTVLLVETAADSIGSDLELRLVLDGALDNYGDNQEVRDAVREAIDQIGSDRERSILSRRLYD
jgi:beta-lactamase regulating signal transducer with metallopeptidase domain